MDTGSSNLGEFLFNGRWHIVGALMFLVFAGAFLREVVAELMAVRKRRQAEDRSYGMGPIFQGARLGHTMTDGGEPMAEDDAKAEDRETD